MSPTLAASPSTNLAPILIDGCAVPRILYDRVKALAVASNHWQFIGVIYEQSADLKPQADELTARFWDWDHIFHRDAMRRRHMAAGEHLVFVCDQTRNELGARHDLAMILWISPDSSIE
jgi:hypothetical protein